MSILSIINQLNIKLPVCPDIKLGSGQDGEVYSILNNNQQVIKLCNTINHPTLLKHIPFILKYLIEQQPLAYTRVYSYGILKKINNQLFYYYIMELLFNISSDEKKVFHTLLSHEDQNKVKNYSPPQVKQILKGMQLGLDFDPQAIQNFLQQLNNSTIKHNDLHPRNIMKNKDGQFKLVDLDRLTLIGE